MVVSFVERQAARLLEPDFWVDGLITKYSFYVLFRLRTSFFERTGLSSSSKQLENPGAVKPGHLLRAGRRGLGE
jgi:hypothetical protein